METTSSRQITFRKVTIQDGAVFELKSIYGNAKDVWNLKVKKNYSKL